MPVIQKEVSIAAGAVNDNIFAGSAFEFARRRTIVSLGITQAATGMFCTLQAGPDIIAEEFSPAIATRFPIIPDEMYYTDVMEQGDRLVGRVRNPTGGAVITRAIAMLSDIS